MIPIAECFGEACCNAVPVPRVKKLARPQSAATGGGIAATFAGDEAVVEFSVRGVKVVEIEHDRCGYLAGLVPLVEDEEADLGLAASVRRVSGAINSIEAQMLPARGDRFEADDRQWERSY
jgi:hypothetical protein